MADVENTARNKIQELWLPKQRWRGGGGVFFASKTPKNGY